MKKYFRILTGSLLFRVFAPIVIFSIIFTFLGAKLLYDNSLDELTRLNKSQTEAEVKRVFYITESRFTSLFVTHGADPEMFKVLTPSIKQEVITELDKFANYNQFCYGILEGGRPVFDSCSDPANLLTVKAGKQLGHKASVSSALEFNPWQWDIIVYTKTSYFEKTAAVNTKVIALSIGAFTASILLFFLLVFYVMVRRPFSIVLDTLNQMESGRYEELDLYSSREMHSIVEGINRLGNAIKKRTEELVEANRVLNDRVKEETAKNMDSARIIYEQQRHQALSSMLMNIAHHWRQPLNIISLMIQDIQEEVNNGTISKEYMDKTSMQALSELKGMSNTITRFTRLYESSDGIDRINLHEQCLHAIEYIRNMLSAAEMHFDLNVPEDLTVYATEQDILELFMKLLDNISNAVKERKRASVSIHISAVAISEGTIIVVEDDAGGIPAEILDKVFEPYTTTSFKQRQKGLGLYLLKRILEEKYDGSIKAENARNGTRVTVFIKNLQ